MSQTPTLHEHMLCRELAGAGVVEALIGMLRTGNAQGQIYASQALCNMAADFQVRERIITAGQPSDNPAEAVAPEPVPVSPTQGIRVKLAL